MKNILKTFIALIITSPIFLFAQDVSVGERLGFLTGEGFQFGNFLMLVFGILGVILLGTGIWGLKKYADDSRTNQLAKPLIYAVAGGLMTAISVFQGILAFTLTGASDDESTGRSQFRAADTD